MISVCFAATPRPPPRRGYMARSWRRPPKPAEASTAASACRIRPRGDFDLILPPSGAVLRGLAAIRGGGVARQRMFLICYAGDMDHNLREMGVGDLRGGKKIAKEAEAFYGRLEGTMIARSRGPATTTLRLAFARKVLGAAGHQSGSPGSLRLCHGPGGAAGIDQTPRGRLDGRRLRFPDPKRCRRWRGHRTSAPKIASKIPWRCRVPPR